MTVPLTATSFDGTFRTLLESELYLPKSWHEDRVRCRAAKIPDGVVYRTKCHMALEPLDRAAAHGVRCSWITADEWYSQKPAFIAGLEQRGRRFVLEVPKNFPVWLSDPQGAKRPTTAKPVETLRRHSKPRMQQPWQAYRLNDADKGPLPQAHFAAHALIASLPLSPDDRRRHLARAAATLKYRQRRNAQARASPTKTRRERLRDLGDHADQLPRCAPG